MVRNPTSVRIQIPALQYSNKTGSTILPILKTLQYLRTPQSQSNTKRSDLSLSQLQPNNRPRSQRIHQSQYTITKALKFQVRICQAEFKSLDLFTTSEEDISHERSKDEGEILLLVIYNFQNKIYNNRKAWNRHGRSFIF